MAVVDPRPDTGDGDGDGVDGFAPALQHPVQGTGYGG
jgi:hypothetical protein